MDYLGKKEMLTNAICAGGTFRGSFISAHKTWDRHVTVHIFLCERGSQLLYTFTDKIVMQAGVIICLTLEMK